MTVLLIPFSLYSFFQMICDLVTPQSHSIPFLFCSLTRRLTPIFYLFQVISFALMT